MNQYLSQQPQSHYRVLLVIVFLLVSTGAFAQYQVHQWTSFEDGTLGLDASSFGGQIDRTVRVVELGKVEGMPAEFNATGSSQETGRYCLELTADPNSNVPGSATTGLIVGTTVDREKLGPNGRALYQADFFIPKDAEIPSLAVVAMAPIDENETSRPATISAPRKFYRFGITLGKIPYFSYVTPEKATAKVYRNDNQILELIPKPGWHRFALVVTGGRDIFCYIDGRGTNFSPLWDQSLNKMLVGVMLAESKRSYRCYVDNLSIQVSPEVAPVPDSPYTGWTIPAGEALLRSGSSVGSEAVRDLRWLEPALAWNRAQKEKIPMVLFFYTPRHTGSERVNQMFTRNPAAGKFLDTHACSRIDVNQLRGGSIAKEYGIFRVPAFLSIAPNAQTFKRYQPGKTDEWDTIAAQLDP